MEDGRLADRARIRARNVGDIKRDHGAKAIGALVSPHSTVEELFLAGKLVRGLGSENIDYRLRNAEFAQATRASAGWAPASRRCPRCSARC